MFKYKLLYPVLLLLLSSCESSGPVVHKSIAGVWRCEDINNSTITRNSYLLDIYRKQSDSTLYVITNFFQAGDNEFIVVKNNDGKLILAEQSLTGMNLKKFSATVIDLHNISLQYTIYDGQRDNVVDASYSRK
ncbi:MAG: hypothetical protein JXR27_08290 [Paludibacteraceae bacterium]|nr:hypothetical protein [Paludibacteraceae bacterium]